MHVRFAPPKTPPFTMVDESTKKALAAIPLLKTKAGPRDGDAWVARLKEEYISLIKVSVHCTGS